MVENPIPIRMFDLQKSRSNMKNSSCYILMVGESGIHPNCQLEYKWAKEFHKPVIVLLYDHTKRTQVEAFLGNYSPVEYIENSNGNEDEMIRKLQSSMKKYQQVSHQ